MLVLTVLTQSENWAMVQLALAIAVEAVEVHVLLREPDECKKGAHSCDSAVMHAIDARHRTNLWVSFTDKTG